MPKYTIKFTHFVEVEWGAYKHIEADNIEEAEKIAIEAGKNDDFDDVDTPSGRDWSLNDEILYCSILMWGELEQTIGG